MKKLLSILALGVLTATGAHAQAWPSKAINLIVPFPAGGSTDSVARAIGPKITAKLGQPVVVDNKAGATGTIGATQVKRAAPDGYTFLVTSLGPLVIAPHLIKGMQYDALKDFDPITVAVQAPNVLVVPANSPYKSLADLMAALKANPGKVTFASSGNGTSDHLTAELFWQRTGTKGVHVPYKGGAPVLNDLLGGQVDATFTNINILVPSIVAGKLRALATTGAKRSPQLPDVPTLDELGIKGVTVYSWQAFAAPKGTPADIRSKLQVAIAEALKDPEVNKHLLDLGFEIVANTPEEFTAFQASEFARWKKVIEAGKITAD